jgi:hypothetical protein
VNESAPDSAPIESRQQNNKRPENTKQRNLYKMFKNTILSTIAAVAMTAAPAFAADYTITFVDPVADSTGAIDATRMVVVFNNVTGDYKVTFTSTGAQPFNQNFRLNVNLFNQARLPNHSLFTDTVNDYNLTSAKTKMILKGNSPALTQWAAGDVVATNTAASGGVNPPGIMAYRTSVVNFPLELLTNEDAIAYGPSGTATVVPLTAQMAVSGLMDDVQSLYEDGALNREQAAALQSKLSRAVKALNDPSRSGQAVSCAMMTAFMNDVQDLVTAGALHPKMGINLTNSAMAAASLMGC